MRLLPDCTSLEIHASWSRPWTSKRTAVTRSGTAKWTRRSSSGSNATRRQQRSSSRQCCARSISARQCVGGSPMASDIQPSARFFQLSVDTFGRYDTEFDAEPHNMGDAPHCPNCGDPIGLKTWLPPYQGDLELHGEGFGDFVR